MAHACGVSRRTIFRDLSTLRESDVPLVYDENLEQYRIPGTYYLPPTNFTPEEAMTLIVLCNDLGDRNQLPFFHSARSAALKLEGSLPDRLRELLRASGQRVEIRLGSTNPLTGQEPIYEQLTEALRRHCSARIGYRGPLDKEEISTRLRPYRLMFSRRSWYVVGRSSLHRQVRTFNVGRIRRLELLDDHYEIPRGFSIDRYLRNAWRLIPEPGPDREVVVRFGKLVAQNVAEVRWHKTQRLHFNPDGTLDFHVTVSGLNEISWWILGYADQAEVLEPDELRRIVVAKARRMLKQYEDEA